MFLRNGDGDDGGGLENDDAAGRLCGGGGEHAKRAGCYPLVL